jgi:hypothetical protein
MVALKDDHYRWCDCEDEDTDDIWTAGSRSARWTPALEREAA